MARISYQTVLRAKGIKPIRHPAHTDKSKGGIELLPVDGVYTHLKPADDNVVELIKRDLRSAVQL